MSDWHREWDLNSQISRLEGECLNPIWLPRHLDESSPFSAFILELSYYHALRPEVVYYLFGMGRLSRKGFLMEALPWFEQGTSDLQSDALTHLAIEPINKTFL